MCVSAMSRHILGQRTTSRESHPVAIYSSCYLAMNPHPEAPLSNSTYLS